jgi:hypothetical protein
VLDAVIVWSGWAFGLLSIPASVLSMRQAVVERRRTRRVIEELTADVEAIEAKEETSTEVLAAGTTSTAVPAPRGETSVATAPPPAVPPAPPKTASENRTVRSILIQTAVDRQTLADALEKARVRGIAADVVIDLAGHLRESKLLKYSDPLNPETSLALN